jgi:hypothetical protein
MNTVPLTPKTRVKAYLAVYRPIQSTHLRPEMVAEIAGVPVEQLRNDYREGRLPYGSGRRGSPGGFRLNVEQVVRHYRVARYREAV